MSPQDKEKIRFNTIWICKECGQLDPCIFISKGTARGPIICPYEDWDADWKEYGREETDQPAS